MSIITLLTDFGDQDYFVGAMKGVVLSINPAVSIVDITHRIPARDIEAAAFNLLACYRDFPIGTIHVAVVDPGVGSSRRALAIDTGEHFFIGPDNGLFSWICEREKQYRVVAITNEQLFRRPLSPTFHGRDVFAPVAAALSRGTKIDELGEEVTDIVRLPPLTPTGDGPSFEGRIIHTDHFGNCITSFSFDHTNEQEFDAGARLRINEREIRVFHRYFADAKEGELFCYFGSAGFLEIGLRNSSAQAILNAKRGQTIHLDKRPTH